MISEQSIFELGFGENQAPCEEVELSSRGQVPIWLEGSFIRNGPGLYEIGGKRFNHWFDGLGMLHKFDFKEGKVLYKSNFIECHSTTEALKDEEQSYSEFATDPCWSIFGKLRSIYKHGPTDSAKVSVGKIGTKYFALGETTMQIEFDPKTLKTLSRYNFNQPKVGTSSTAHPHVEDKDAYNLVTKYGPIDRYQILKMDKDATKVASIFTPNPSYMHSFGMTKKYYVIAESPYTVQSIKLIASTQPFIKNFKWNKKRGSKIWVIDRGSGKTVFKKEVPPFFFFHFVNTFDTEQGLTFDIVSYPNADVIESFYLKNIESHEKSIPGGNLHRYELDIDSKSFEHKVLSKEPIEMPSYDSERYSGREDYNYVYATGLGQGNPQFYNQITKINIREESALKWFEQGSFPGEPVFIQNPDSQAEDDGLILSLVIDTKDAASFLLILNASNFKEIARVYTPEAILAGFHGGFFNNDAL